MLPDADSTIICEKILNLCCTDDSSNVPSIFYNDFVLKYKFTIFAHHINKHAGMPRHTCDHMAIIYKWLISLINNGHRFTQYHIFKLYLAMIILYSKFYADDYCSINFYAKISTISPNEVIRCESALYRLMNYDLYMVVSQDEAMRILHDPAYVMGCMECDAIVSIVATDDTMVTVATTSTVAADTDTNTNITNDNITADAATNNHIPLPITTVKSLVDTCINYAIRHCTPIPRIRDYICAIDIPFAL